MCTHENTKNVQIKHVTYKNVNNKEGKSEREVKAVSANTEASA